MTKTKILIVDDEKDIIELVKYHLEKTGYKVIATGSGGDALDIAAKQNPALVILDIMLPGLDGFEICRILKRNDTTKNIPVIMLTAKTAESDIITGLKTGADDYLTKPFSPKVLLARVETVLRRGVAGKEGSIENAEIKTGQISVNPASYEVTVAGSAVSLTKIEFSILLFLIKNEGKVMSREQILNGAWSYDTAIVDRAVDVHIKHIREKLGKAGRSIETVRGIGYKYKEQ